MNNYILKIIIGLLYSSLCAAQTTQQQTACALTGKSLTIDCGTGNAVLLYESILGAKQQENGECSYTSGDCFENFQVTCLTDQSKCSAFAPIRNLTSCNKKSSYLEIKYYCVPTSTSSAKTFDICSTSEITIQSGIIRSPGYPTYKTTDGSCQTKITVPSGKSINIFVSDMNILKRDSSENCVDYLRITDSTGTEDVCGIEKTIFAESLCSSVVYLNYKATTPAAIFTLYKGFKLYFEVRDLGASSSCGTATPPIPVDTTTTAFVPTVNPLDLLLNASSYFEFQVCKGQSKALTAPDFHVLYIEQLDYRAQPLQILCQSPSSSHCSYPHPITCNLKQSCPFNLLADYTINSCSSKKADYIFGIYRYIPIQSKIRFFVCDTNVVNSDLNPNGVLFSKNYPNYTPNSQCVLKLQSSSLNKAFKIYITDISLEDDCTKSYVQINDYRNPPQSFCSSINPRETYTYITCSNQVDISYKTNTQPSTEFRGFRAYYEVIDAPSTCNTVLTTTAQVLTTSALNDDVISQVMTMGGNANGKPCYFPFKYQNNNYDTCIADGSNYWCSATDNYDRDGLRGNCVPGFTTNQKFSICDRKLRTFSCPKGYYINIISALGGSTTDNSCDENKIRCSQSLFNQVQSFAGSKQSYRIVNSFPLTECSNARSDILIIDYNCIPETVPYVKAYDQCSSNTISDEKAIITSPFYPIAQNNLNCALNIVINSQKILNLYIVSTELQAVIGTQECTESYIQLNNGEKICGNRKSGIIAQKCGTNFRLSYFVGSKSYKGFKMYYELTDVIDQIQCFEPTTTISPISTSYSPPPIYVQQGIASGTQTIVNCKFSETITCPDNYIISVRRYFYGRSSSNKCFYTQGDLISYSYQNVNCNGKKTCVLPSYFQFMVEHNALATYLQVEYECIPTNLSPKIMCGMSFSDRNGIITTTSYPSYDQSSTCKATITTTSQNIIKAYIINLSIDKDCTKDSIKFSEPSTTNQVEFCGQVVGSLAFETCDRQLDINIVTRASPDNSFDGVSIYYEAIQKPLGFICNPITTTVTTPKPTTSTTVRTTTTLPSYLGLASPVNTLVRCKSETIACPANYVIVIRSSFYGVKNSDSCDYNPNDCFGPNTGPLASCSGRQSCLISFFLNTAQVPECQRKFANYFFLDYQCVPAKNAGMPPNSVNSEFCSPSSATYNINPGSSILIQSQNYPSYPTSAFNCSKSVKTDPGYALDVYLLGGSFPGRVDCNGTNEFVIITDGFSKFKFCGSPIQAKYLMETRSNQLDITLQTTPQLLGFAFKGFQLYIQTVKLPITTSRPSISSTKPPTTVPIELGFLSQEYYTNMCVFESKSITCPNDYLLVILQQSIVNSRDGCSFKPGDCREPTDLVSTECSGKQSCNIYFPYVPITFCGKENANGLEFTYQCVPSTPSQSIKTYSCDDKEIKNIRNGFIQSPNYPKYELNVLCTINLIPPEKSYVKIYLIDIALSDNIFDDALRVDELILGENEDGLSRYLYSSEKTVSITYKSLASANDSALGSLRGFRFYFETFSINDNKTSTTRIPQTTRNFNQFTFFTRITGRKMSNNLIYASLGIGLTSIIILVLAILFLNRSSGAGVNLEIKFSNTKGTDGKLNEDIRSFSNPNLE